MENIHNGFKKIGEIAVTIVAISFIFYFVGFIYEASFFTSLGISRVFLDPSEYYSHIMRGVLTLFIFAGFIPIFIERYNFFKLVKEIEEDIKNEKDKDNEKFKIFEDIKSEVLSPMYVFKSFINWRSIFIVLPIVIAIIFIKNYQLLLIAVFIQMLVGLFIYLILINETKKIVLNINRSGTKIFLIFNLIIFGFMFFYPIFSGYTDGIIKSKDNLFTKMNIVTKDEIINDAEIIDFTNDMYIVRKDNMNFFIPASEIKKMENFNQ